MDCFLVIPCFYESKRLPAFLEKLCSCIQKGGLSIELQLVDDGSDEEELRALRKLCSQLRNSYSFLTEVFAMKRNMGKGAAIRHGWSLAPEGARLLGFVDADGSVSAEETLRLLKDALGQTEPSLTLASRRAAGAKVKRSILRKCVAAGFACLVRFSYGIRISDTQCGCKFVDATWYGRHSLEFNEEEFGLDLELILKAKESDLAIREIGIAWHEVAGSKVKPGVVWSLGKKVLLRRIGLTPRN